MAITASIAMSSATIKTLQKSTATITVSNSGGSTVYVTAVEPYATVTSATPTTTAVQLGRPNTGPGMTLSVAASGTLALPFDVVPMAPNVNVYDSNPWPSAGVGGVAITPLQPESNPAQIVYDIGAFVYTSDGSATKATTATLTVNAVKVGI